MTGIGEPSSDTRDATQKGFGVMGGDAQRTRILMPREMGWNPDAKIWLLADLMPPRTGR